MASASGSRYCLSLIEEDPRLLQKKIDRYGWSLPFVEVRLDRLRELRLPRLPKSSCEFVATCRPRREGGKFAGPERERIELLQKAAAVFQWVDLEHDVEAPPDFPASTRVIRSRHCFGAFPADPAALLKELERLSGHAVKLAVQVSSTQELVQLLRLMEASPPSKPWIVIGMGRMGQASRLLGMLLGCLWTYVAETGERAAAPGQFSLEQARSWAAPQSDAALYGLLGNPVSHSFSPDLHNALFRRYGLNKVYFPFQLDELAPWFDYMEDSLLRFEGFSVTIPFKERVLPFLQETDSPVGAVNTLFRSVAGWSGVNTDYQGFLKPLTKRFELKGKSAVVLGCGGAAHTVVKALVRQGAEVFVAGRDPARTAAFAALHGCRWGALDESPPGGDLLVNATPVGQYPAVDECLLDGFQLNFEMVYDLVYHPSDTLLLRRARRRGARTLSGLEMFLEQAALQFKLWTGIEPERRLMSELIEESLSRP